MKKKSKAWAWEIMAVLVFGIWHYLDVCTGAMATNDRWLLKQYLCLFIATVIGLAFLGRIFFAEEPKFLKKIHKSSAVSLEMIYLAAGIFFGVLYMLVLAPLSAPDEICHYTGAYRLSSYLLGKPAVNRSGYVLVRAQDMWLEDVGNCYEYETDEDGYLKVIPESTKDAWFLGEPLMERTYREIWEKGLGGLQYPKGADRKERLAASVYLPVETTPIVYIPQALGVSLARLLNLNSLWIAYLGRLFNLLFFVTMTFFSIRRLPFGKEVLFGVALLPMSLHQSASFSYDVMISGCMFYFTAICLDLAYCREKVRVRDIIEMALLMAAAGPCKMVYGILMGLCLLIPVRKFGGWKNWLFGAAAVGGCWGLAMLLVNGQTVAGYAAEAESYVAWADEAGYSLKFLIHRPLLLIQMFYHTLLWQGEQYHLSMIGAYLGNLDHRLDVPYVAVLLFTVCLLGLAMKKPGETQIMSGKGRIWTAVVCTGCMAAIMLSMLIALTPVSSPVISGVQGRYFLPFLPVLLMAFKNDWIILTKNGNRSILYLMCCANGYVLLRLYSVVSMRM